MSEISNHGVYILIDWVPNHKTSQFVAVRVRDAFYPAILVLATDLNCIVASTCHPGMASAGRQRLALSHHIWLAS
jgi:hypothetical protein